MKWITGYKPNHLMSYCYLHRYWSEVDSLKWDVNWILRKPVLSYGSQWSLSYLVSISYETQIGSRLILCIRVFW